MQVEILHPSDLQPILDELRQLRELVQEVHRRQQPGQPSPLEREPRSILPLSTAAKLAGVSLKTLHQAIDAGLISAAPVKPGGKLRISRTELIRFVNELGHPTIQLRGNRISPRMMETISKHFKVVP